MKGLLATNGTMPSSSYLNALRPPIHTSTTTSPIRVTVMPTLSRRAAISNNLLNMAHPFDLEVDFSRSRTTGTNSRPVPKQAIVHNFLSINDLRHDLGGKPDYDVSRLHEFSSHTYGKS